MTHLAGVLAAGAGRVVLDETTYGSYQRAADRILGIWHAGSTMDRAWYRRGPSTAPPGAIG